MNDYKFCILSSNEDIIEHEKGLYDSYVNRIPNKWIIDNYKHIDDNRLQSEIAYSQLLLFAIKNNSKILGSAVVNTELNKISQIKKMGFDLENYISDNNNYCEALTFYVLNDSLKSNFLEVSIDFAKYCYLNLKNKNFDFVFTTCSEKLVKLYKYLGFDEINKIQKNNEFKYLLIKKLNE